MIVLFGALFKSLAMLVMCILDSSAGCSRSANAKSEDVVVRGTLIHRRRA